MALSPEDTKLLLNALMTVMHLQERLSNNDLTIQKLKKLLGIVKSSEKFSGLFGKAGDAEGLSAGNKPSHRTPLRKKRVKKTPEPSVCHHKISGLEKGQVCPECNKGKLYKYEPAKLLRITGQTPFTPVMHLSERLRCNLCGTFFTAELPQEVLSDGASDQKYGYSARALMAINKYFAGSPFYRQESLQDILGMSVSASTIFDQCEYLANDLAGITKTFDKLAAGASYFWLDDTSNRVLELKPVKKKKRNSEKEQIRSGIYTSGLIAETKDGHKIVSFKTNIGHGGEFIDSILEHRQSGMPPPVLMSDALSSNNPTVTYCLRSLCNSHGRRQFADLTTKFPEETRHVLRLYGQIWQHEDQVRKQSLSASERLVFHQNHSLPVMEEIRQWGNQKLDSKEAEPNGGLGKAIRYFLRHYEGLTAFCRIEGAAIDNNIMESTLRVIVLGRKNAYFYKTATGAAIADTITSVVATCHKAGVNVFDYLVAVQKHKDLVSLNPDLWLPWNYQESLPK